MSTPFIFGKLAVGTEFTDRDQERNQLNVNFNSLINTILISPRRWGKSSLVTTAAEQAQKKNPNLRFCLMDLYNVRTEEEFYQLLSTEVLKATSSKMDEVLENVRNFFAQFIPKIQFTPDPTTEFSISLDWEAVKKQPGEILNLAEAIAKARGIKLIICIDEFQNISGFEDPIGFQKKLRAHWQKHQHVGYCLYGSKRHMLIEVFASPSMPFYKFGELIFLQKIIEKDWIKFIKKRFRDTGKSISKEAAARIASYAECHPYYVQQLAQQTWLRCEKEATEQHVDKAFESLLMQLSLLFQRMTDELSTTQLNFLKAMLEGVEQFSSKKNIAKYQLGTSANVNRIKTALINKEILDDFNNRLSLLDPMYSAWLRLFYFKIR